MRDVSRQPKNHSSLTVQHKHLPDIVYGCRQNAEPDSDWRMRTQTGGLGLVDADWRTRTGGRGLADSDWRTRTRGRGPKKKKKEKYLKKDKKYFKR